MRWIVFACLLALFGLLALGCTGGSQPVQKTDKFFSSGRAPRAIPPGQ